MSEETSALTTFLEGIRKMAVNLNKQGHPTLFNASIKYTDGGKDNSLVNCDPLKIIKIIKLILQKL